MTSSVKIELALQGGGAHGAFTWGVLDRLLDEDWISIAAVSGASAGAMNAVVLADGLLEGGHAGAQRALRRLWQRVSRASSGGAPTANALHQLFFPGTSALALWPGLQAWNASIAAWSAVAESMLKVWSPYEFNPFNANPLLDLIADVVDFERLRQAAEPKVFVSATDVSNGRLRVFRNADISAHAVMASACLPQLFQAVEIDGAEFWDGGYVANPALQPLIAESHVDDLLVVQLNPLTRAALPRSSGAIAARLNEITFNASLSKELQGLALLHQALEEEPPEHRFRHPYFDQVRRLRIHRIAADEQVFALNSRSKLNPEWAFLLRLHAHGVAAADAFLEHGGADLGQRSTLDLAALIANPGSAGREE